MFNKILVLLDGSTSAEAVLPYVEKIGRRFASEIHLLHVCTSECGTTYDAHKTYLDRMADNLRNNLDIPTSTTIMVTSQVEKGSALETIGSFIAKNSIELVALTNSGMSVQKAGMFGKVADHITRTIKTPVLLIKPGLESPLEKSDILVEHLLLPLDGSALSKLALPVVEALAARLQVPFTLFQMAREIYPYYGEAAAFVDYQKLTDDEKLKVQAELTSLKEDLTRRGLSVDWQVNVGNDAAYEIIEISKKINHCLVVMSTHGRSGIGRWAFGSVADKVIHYVEKPLLLIPAASGW